MKTNNTTTQPLLRALLAFVGLLIAGDLLATHNRSGEIHFRKTGGLGVEVSIVTYTYAPSVAADRDTLTLCWGDGTCETVVRINGKGELLEANFKRNIYTGSHQYAAEGIYLISMTDYNRSAGILNLNAPISENIPFHLQATLRLLPDAANSSYSPYFLEPPVDNGFVNQPFVHAPNAFDLDGDSMVYDLVIPMQGIDLPVPNYQYPNEIRPGANNHLSLDSRTGKLVWDAPQVAGDYVIAIRVRTFRGNNLVEETLRDLYVSIRPLFNIPPQLQIDVPEDSIVDLSLGQTFEVAVSAGDPNVGQQVALSASSGLLEAVFQEKAIFDTLAGKFVWTVRAEHLREQPYTIVFKAKDDFYNHDGAASFKTLLLRVRAVVDAGAPTDLSQQALAVYPNPLGTDALLHWQAKKQPATALCLFDGQGHSCYLEKWPGGNVAGIVDLARRPAGLYLLKVYFADGSAALRRVIKS